MKRIHDPVALTKIKNLLKRDGFRNVVDHIECMEGEMKILQQMVHEMTDELNNLKMKINGGNNEPGK